MVKIMMVCGKVDINMEWKQEEVMNIENEDDEKVSMMVRMWNMWIRLMEWLVLKADAKGLVLLLQYNTIQYNTSRKFVSHNQNFNALFWSFDLITRSSSEEVGTQFFRVLTLDATISCRIKKTVVGVTQLITALVSVHSSMTFRVDMYSFLDHLVDSLVLCRWP